MFLDFSRLRLIHLFKATRFLHMQKERKRECKRVKIMRKSVERRIACYSVVGCFEYCCGILAWQGSSGNLIDIVFLS